MLHEILNASRIPYRQGRYLNPPEETYAVYFDDLTADGPDPIPLPNRPYMLRHDVMVELYEPRPDTASEESIEAELNARGILWAKEDRYWLQNVQRHQVVYEFTYFEKVRT